MKSGGLPVKRLSRAARRPVDDAARDGHRHGLPRRLRRRDPAGAFALEYRRAELSALRSFPRVARRLPSRISPAVPLIPPLAR